MEVLFKICGVLLVSCCAALMIRRSNPEMSLALSAAALIAVLGASLTLLRPMRDMWEKAQDLYGVEELYLLPLFKCNPLYHILRFVRTILMDGISPEPKAYLLMILVSFLPLAAGIFVFKKTQDRFVLYI